MLTRFLKTTNLRRAIVSFVLLGVVSVALLVGCQSQPTSPAAQPTQAAAAPVAQPTSAPETLKVGIIQGITGQGARFGMIGDRFLRMAIDEVTAKGGVKVAGKTYRFEGVTADDKATSDGGREAANKLILADKVRYVTGAGSSSAAAGAQTATESAKVLLLASATADSSLGSKFPLTFQMSVAPMLSRANVLYDWIGKERPNVKRLAIVQSDDAMGRAQVEAAELAAQAKGITIVAKEYFPLDTKDFSPLVTRLLRQNPDSVHITAGVLGALFISFMQALNDQGFKGQTQGLHIDAPSVAKGGKALEGYVATTLLDRKSSVVSSGERDLFERYIQKYSEADLELSSAGMYNSVLVLAQAMQLAGTVDDTEKLAKALREGEFETTWSKELGKGRIVGAKTFGLPATLEQAIYLSQVQDSKGVTLNVLKATVP